YARFPKLCEAVRTRYIHYNETMEYLEKLEKEGKIFVLRPRMKAISRMEQDHRKTLAFYQDGYDLMKEEYDRMMDYLER
ncbi:MAG: patatin family protein, partial [Oscillospiraceae bacterium]|nr:patatin family protein [Oscillospiraceae bacterium]